MIYYITTYEIKLDDLNAYKALSIYFTFDSRNMINYNGTSSLFPSLSLNLSSINDIAINTYNIYYCTVLTATIFCKFKH